MLQKTFGAWKKKDVPPVTDVPARPLPTVTKAMPVRLVDKPDATQSSVMVIGPGIRHADPQYYAVRLMNYALGGGGFSSRLMKVVRSEGGKTYGVRSSFDAGRDAGPFEASHVHAQRRDGGDGQAGASTRSRKMRAGGPTEEELKAAKDNLIGGFGLRLETGSDLAGELIGAEIDGLDNKYVVDYPARLDAVTRQGSGDGGGAASRSARAHRRRQGGRGRAAAEEGRLFEDRGASTISIRCRARSGGRCRNSARRRPRCCRRRRWKGGACSAWR